MRQLSRKRWDKALALIAAALVIGLWLANEQPWRPALVVWCWGSSYEAQADFAREFGRRHRCKVVVVGGPAERLAVLAGASRRRADVFVAPAGPEWEWMRRQGLVTRGPEVFAFDPYVIVVPAGNPAGIKSEQDLGAGAYASIAPEAMWPKGKCIAALLDAIAAGLDAPWVPEAYYYAARSRVNDGRLLFRPLKQGKAYVTITQRSQTTLPEAKGLEVIDINPRFQVKMKGCSNTIAQCVGVLNGARRPEFAEAYADELLGAQAQELLSRHGFYHVADAKARPFRELRPDFVPYQPHEAQQRLAEELMADGLWDIALGEWLKLIHLFGPSPFDAKATYYAGYCAMQHGLKRGAAAMWRRCAQLYSR
ncbi:MAG: substrate-binding domain-containing protein, partial [Armatimonadetes bacterium]|nr:substrate-binding domain-containing protein [Armatimonadota bacterium]